MCIPWDGFPCCIIRTFPEVSPLSSFINYPDVLIPVLNLRCAGLFPSHGYTSVEASPTWSLFATISMKTRRLCLEWTHLLRFAGTVRGPFFLRTLSIRLAWTFAGILSYNSHYSILSFFRRWIEWTAQRPDPLFLERRDWGHREGNSTVHYSRVESWQS